MNHGEQIRALMLKAHKSHKEVNHTIRDMKIEISKNSIVLKLNCWDADGEEFQAEHGTTIDGSISDAIDILKNKF